MDLAAAARRLRALHRPGEPVVLANAWDAASARSFAGLGVEALATTSAGVALSLGFEDGEAIPPDEMFAGVARIAAAVAVPVTADLEAGYRLPASELVERLLTAGCVGLNLEDTDHAAGRGQLVAAEAQAERLAAVKAAGRAAGVDVVLNARVDAYLARMEPAERVDQAIRRGRLYREAGADCVYPIFATDEKEIAEIVAGVEGPVNVLALPNVPPVARLAQLGVARVTFGALLFKRALTEAERVLRESLPDRHSTVSTA